MGMLEDIMLTLERIPIWKRVKALPSEIDELRARVAAIEARLAGTSGECCPLCGSDQFKAISTKKHPLWGDASGLMLDQFKCGACGHSEDRERETRKS